MKEVNPYIVLVSFIGIRSYSIQAESREDAAKKVANKIINDKFRSGEFLRYYNFPILVAVRENPRVKGSILTLYRVEDGGPREAVKRIRTIDEIEPFLRSDFRPIRRRIKDINDFRRIIEIITRREEG